MDNQYFGTITHPNFLDWDNDTQNKYLLDIGLFTIMIEGNNIPIAKSKVPGKLEILAQFDFNNKRYVCNTQLQKSIYYFLLDRYYAYSKAIPITFFIEFENSIFGLEDHEAKKEALSKFNAIYEKLRIKSFSKKDRFELLYLEREHISSNISKERDIVITFLTGNEDFFDVELYHSNLYLQKIISFEGNLEILLELNKTYTFQTDIYFNENALLFEKYQSIYNPPFSFEVFKFINDQIKTQKKSKRAELVSLFFFLKENILFSGTEKSFRKLINDFFHPISAELKLADQTNKNHINRMEILNLEWDKFNK